MYNESQIDFWSVCVKNHHVRKYGGRYEQFLMAYLGLDGESENDDIGIDSAEALFSSFQIERLQSQRVEQHFVEGHSVRIDAVGFVRCVSSAFEVNYGMPFSYEIVMLWRRPSARKRIPKRLDENFGDISQIMDPYRCG